MLNVEWVRFHFVLLSSSYSIFFSFSDFFLNFEYIKFFSINEMHTENI